MESTVLSLGKSVLDGAVSYTKSAIAEEVALQLGVQSDQAFIKDELEMMQAFLMAAHEERDNHEVLKTWVKQVRDVAYDVEDCLQDFAIHLKKPSWWRTHRTLRERHRIAKQMKELRARVEDVSRRNKRYHLIKGSGSKTATKDERSSITGAAMFGIDEARRAAKQDEAKVDLVQLINKKDEDLRVIAVCGTSGNRGQTFIIRAAYESPDIKGKFPCRAWVRVMHPFNPIIFAQSLVKQFHTTVGVDVLLETKKTGQDLAQEFKRCVNKESFLIVLNDLSTIEEWDQIKNFFPNTKKGSRIVVSAEQVEVAGLCAGQGCQVSELKELSADQTIYAFYEKGSQDGIGSTKPESSSNAATTSTNNSTVPTGEILEDQSKGADGKKVVGKSLTRIRTMKAALEESQLVGREKEKSDIIKLISNQDGQQFQVISLWGMGGLGKTALAKDIYQSQELSGTFDKRAFVQVMHPFSREELRSLVKQLDEKPLEKKDVVGLLGSTKESLASMGLEALNKELAKFLGRHSCLIVLDDVSSTADWDVISQSFPEMKSTTRIIVTTREENIAKHCSEKQENIYKLKVLEYKDAQDLFTKKVFKETVDLKEQYPELVEEAKLILKECNGLPLAIVTIGGFLANQPKTAVEWRKLNEYISVELEMNPKLEPIRKVLVKSYFGLPYHLKTCFLYLSIFPKDYKVNRTRLVRRWIAEGYSRETRGKSAEEIADSYFMELISRSMILTPQQSIYSRKGIDYCQVHDLIHEIGMSKSMEENLVFRLEEGCSVNSQDTVRHLAVSSSWEGEQGEFESIVDMSRIRSLTVFGKWKPFFISDKMRLLRVLDLTNTEGLVDHHLEHIGKLFHLTYLSIRECNFIFYLPDSVGNLRQLQTLDIEGTNVRKLPKTIIKLGKLQYIRAGAVGSNDDSFEELQRNKLCHLIFLSVAFCVACCAPQLLKLTGGLNRRDLCIAFCAPRLLDWIPDMEGDTNRRDVCTLCCCALLPLVAMCQAPRGVAVPRGIQELKALHTLGIVNISRGKAVIQDIKKLAQLRKLGVTGVNKKNAKELFSAIAALSRLESLLVQSEGEPGLAGCLDGMPSPPKNLRSLKLYGNLVKLPGWIQGLENLVKLKLRSTRISELDAAMQVLGKLPNLGILRLWQKSFQGEELRFNLRQTAFPSLMVLELVLLDNLESVEFEEGATPKLELLDFCGWREEAKIGLFSGLPSLPSLKEFLLVGVYEDDFVEYLRTQLAANTNRPVLKRY